MICQVIALKLCCHGCYVLGQDITNR